MLSESKASPMPNNTSPSNDHSSPREIKKSKRKLFSSENSQTVPDASDKSKSQEQNDEKDSCNLTSRWVTPLSERQQLALLRQLSASSPCPSETCSNSSDDAQDSPDGRRTRLFHKHKRNERGETPLHLATIKGDLQKVRKLLNQGARVNAADFAGWTPLHEACNYGWLEIAKILIQFGADVNATGLDKDTPLHDAAVNKHEKIVNLLLKYGADPNKKNANWRTPFDVARSEKVAEVIKEAIQNKEKKDNKNCSQRNHLRTPETVSNRQSVKSPCHSITDLCDPTMRKNSPQNQTHKGADKPTSPRLTLRFQSIKSRDDKSSNSAKVNDVSSPQPKYQSYCVTMETKGDVYDFHKEEAAVSSTQNVTPVAESEETATKCEVVTSTCKETDESVIENEPEGQENVAPDEKMDISDSSPSKVNGGRFTSEVSNKDSECDVEKEESRCKRRKSSDSNSSRHNSSRGHKSPSSKAHASEGDQRSPKSRKRGSLSSSDTESNQSEAEAPENEANAESVGSHNGIGTIGPHSPKVPPLKIVIPSGSGSLEHETRERNKVSSSKQALPYVVNTTSDAVDATNPEANAGPFVGDASKIEQASSKSKEEGHPQEERFQRVTRSSQRMQAAMSGGSSGQCQDPNMVSSSGQKGDLSGESSNDEQLQVHLDVHPRKRKLRTRDTENGSHHPSSASSSSEDSQQQNQLLNSYQMYLNIRKQVDKRRKSMFIVHPKPPQGFKDYLLNRCSYVLEGNAASRFSVPTISPPQCLEGSIKQLFIHQENERYRLRLQHLIEREKLVLSAEQEILRVHGRAARAMANQTVPLSVCSILKDEEIYNVLDGDQDDKDKNVRSRYNGRLFLSWLQDVDDKWEKIKEAMLLRHHNEAESLHAVQKLDWEWKMKELALCDMKTSPVIDDILVPMVHVSDDFDLLPT